MSEDLGGKQIPDKRLKVFDSVWVKGFGHRF